MTDFNNILKNNLVRISPHFHHEKLKIIEKKLKDRNVWIPANSIFKISGGGSASEGRVYSEDATEYLYLRPAEVNIQGIDKNKLPCLSAEIYNQLKKHKIISGELCVSIAGTLGKTALIDTKNLEMNEENLILSNNFIKLTPKKNVSVLFYFYYFWSFIFQVQANRECTITTIKKLGIDKWNYIKVPNIPLPEQKRIVAEIKNELDKQEEVKKKIESERNKIDDIIGFRLEKFN
ncbi:MAG: restriction endonuclease subunit S [Candidatus Moeniiplasma glomeromycotorum]|nr:restriction endonuclease subunit S [Candidatus Moeniiplasma glomeromycotorum]MCE8168426.1 restriction endonuclease subunit S [Candidatus Moeniiplasma glomeromycotorum]MCE8169948.1 restriction endonuclease subunit S [Candidatus Moeniiplasma glomeromycotorum]